MKNLLEILNGCLHIKNFHTKHTAHGCYISLTGGGNHTIYIASSASHQPLSAVVFCAATPNRPVNWTKFTRISLNGECAGKNSTHIGTIAIPNSR